MYSEVPVTTVIGTKGRGLKSINPIVRTRKKVAITSVDNL
ncbi:uncharacterized protein METZ01_LOCUS441884, partial [marine metagenome]